MTPAVSTARAPRGLWVFCMATLVLGLGLALAILAGPRPTPARPLLQASAPTTGDLATADLACAKALARARDTAELPAQEAIARSTAMLRVCSVR